MATRNKPLSRRWRWTAVLLIVAGPVAAEDQAKAARAAAGPTVAVIGREPISAAQLEEKIGAELFELRSQEYQIKIDALDELIGAKLMDREAAARRVSMPELTRAEIDEKAVVSEAETKAFYESHRDRFPGPEAEALKQIEGGLRQERIRERRAAFMGELRAKAGVRVLLDPPRAKVDAGTAPSKGPKNAPVTFIEFSDFQCPYCVRANPTIKRLEQHYKDKLRLVFRNLPLPMHKQAGKAAEAAACAHDQGKFWEMHDSIFGKQGNLQPADLKQRAVDLGLNRDQFNQCLDSGQHEPLWKQDLAEGQRLHLNGTPSFFINGRLLVGALPFEQFTRVIDEELQRAAAPAAGTKP